MPGHTLLGKHMPCLVHSHFPLMILPCSPPPPLLLSTPYTLCTLKCSPHTDLLVECLSVDSHLGGEQSDINAWSRSEEFCGWPSGRALPVLPGYRRVAPPGELMTGSMACSMEGRIVKQRLGSASYTWGNQCPHAPPPPPPTSTPLRGPLMAIFHTCTRWGHMVITIWSTRTHPGSL